MSELLLEMRNFAAQQGVPVLRQEAERLLRLLMARYQPLRILEIGTAIGYSALLMAQLVPNCRILTLEKDEERIRDARRFWDREPVISERIRLWEGDAAEKLSALNETFDFVFIDAAKGHYLSYLQQVLPHLQHGSVILADDVLFYGQVYGPCPRRMRTIAKRMRQYLEFVQNTEQFQTTLYPEGDGLAVSIYQGAENNAIT